MDYEDNQLQTNEHKTGSTQIFNTRSNTKLEIGNTNYQLRHKKTMSNILEKIIEIENPIQDKDNLYFLSCYDPDLKEIYFSEFIQERIIMKEDSNLNLDLKEKMKKRIEKIEEQWESIKNSIEIVKITNNV